MASTYDLTDFSIVRALYVDDGAQTQITVLRNVYLTNALSGLTLYTPVSTDTYGYLKPSRCRRRYIHSPSGGLSAPPFDALTRHFPVVLANVITPPAGPFTIDGVADWVLKGYRGERRQPGDI
jgi:hypothetical protein